jgi:chromosome segregation ATPase
MLVILTLVLSGSIATGVSFLVFRNLSKQATTSVGKERDVIANEIKLYDDATAVAVEKLSGMVSLDERVKIEEEVSTIQKSIDVEKGKVTKIQKDLQSLQERVDQQEAKHSELKRGKEDSDTLAKSLRENRQKFVDEAKNLAESCMTVIQSFSAVSGKLGKDGLEEITELEETFKTASVQLKEFSEFYSRAANRFINLEKQYSELEREFRKLLDKALIGEEVDEDA